MPRKQEVNQQIRDERRERILRVAAAIFAEKGIAAIKIGELAEAAGMSQGLLYRYFSSKEEIFAVLVEKAVHSLIRPMHDILADTDKSAAERLHDLTRLMLDDIQACSQRHRLISQAQALPGQTKEALAEMGNYLQQGLCQLIVAGQQEKKIRSGDPNRLCVLYLSTLQGLAASLHLFGEPIREYFPDVDTVYRLLEA
ncbi:TetR/AcrR family transcriptional regulator [Paenibacillus sp. J22TS3]|uniref:TetR/AcrR family transcriptional regulator n=1 Tax=Paenibacillus sp. J22TS3 TaxID=2807192 RepID=UPI001AFF1C5D|nr:TetR/AcrR family transcriptional regulator [Paenibacillus sp. J22TS3]GIP22311.1 hypothetical protein J22TS3_25860 [Paenibacillus sp. J22TS3]